MEESCCSPDSGPVAKYEAGGSVVLLVWWNQDIFVMIGVRAYFDDLSLFYQSGECSLWRSNGSRISEAKETKLGQKPPSIRSM
jgi:hypothetical protein